MLSASHSPSVAFCYMILLRPRITPLPLLGWVSQDALESLFSIPVRTRAVAYIYEQASALVFVYQRSLALYNPDYSHKSSRWHQN